MKGASPVSVQDLYLDSFAHCYGCGRLNVDGHQLKSYLRGDQVIAVVSLEDRYCGGFPGFAYGGIIASIMDCHGAASAAAFECAVDGVLPRRPITKRFVTASLTVDFRQPTPLGTELTLIGSRVERSERKSVIELQLGNTGTVFATGRLVAVRLPTV